MGNRLREEVRDPTGTLRRVMARQYNALGQLSAQINAPYAQLPDLDDPAVRKSTYLYDGNGNQTIATDALGRVSENRFDELNRLTRSIQDADDGDPGTVNIVATVVYGYDAVDNLRQVIDPNQLVTQYTYDGLNNLTRLTSPDTGITDYTHDDAGNRITQTDARGVVTTYVYDAASRLTDILYPTAPAKNVSFAYDTNPSECGPDERHGQGRLAEMRDASGHTRLCYDRRGNLTAKHQRIDGRDLVTRYRYNAADRLLAVVYPSGFELQLTRDPLGRIASAVLDTGSQTLPIVADLSHLPFGPVSAYPFADGSRLSKQWDLNYWPDAVTSNALDYDYSTDDVGNITGIASGIETNRQYDYDRLDRLSQVRDQNAALIESYAFDPTGNRTQRIKDGATEQLSYANTPAAPIFPTDPTYADFSHRLQSVDATPRTYDEIGNTLTGIPELNAQNASSEYDERNRLTRIISGGIELARYEYNGRGERVAKQTATEAYLYAYDESGQLIGRYVPEGATDWRIDEEILWLDSTPIASVRLDNGQPVIRAIHTDHLNSPRALTSLHGDSQPQGTAVWRWPLTTGEMGGNNAYGTEQALEDPDGDGTRVVFHLRFPGQQYDGESGLHYNYFRDYEAGVGRYVESDPIGLRGGIQPYGYVGARPLRYLDPDGLLHVDASCSEDAERASAIDKAVANVKDKIDQCLNCESSGCIPCDQAALLKTKLETARVKCVRGPGGPCGLAHIRGSARTGTDFTLTGSSFDEDKCGCLEASIFHELLHLIGLSHPPGNNHDYSDPVWSAERSCFPCGIPAIQLPEMIVTGRK